VRGDGSKTGSPYEPPGLLPQSGAVVFRCRPLTGNGKIEFLCALCAFAVSGPWEDRMKKEILDKIEVRQGDITRLDVDAIVNAANTSLLGGGGVDGAIHRAAGPELLEECRRIGGCPTGEARITRGYKLRARHVIHTVGPVYRGRPRDRELLANCYRNSLTLAARNGVTSIAFPAISCGVYGYPIEAACQVAATTAIEVMAANPSIQKLVFILFSADNLKVYRDYLASWR
jgi:O-acetyl-ADP-ribose deacetylase (regulator of RNase III)